VLRRMRDTIAVPPRRERPAADRRMVAAGISTGQAVAAALGCVSDTLDRYELLRVWMSKTDKKEVTNVG
jgi:hypothetical protein